MTIRYILGIHLFAGFLFSACVSANDLQQASQRMCDKVQTCFHQSMAQQQELTPAMRGMMEGMINNMCASIMNIDQAMAKDELVDSAIACLDSVSEASCQMMESGFETQQCKDHTALVEKHYPSH